MISIVGLSLLTAEILIIICVAAYITFHTFKKMKDSTSFIKFMIVILWFLLGASVAFCFYFWLKV